MDRNKKKKTKSYKSYKDPKRSRKRKTKSNSKQNFENRTLSKNKSNSKTKAHKDKRKINKNMQKSKLLISEEKAFVGENQRIRVQNRKLRLRRKRRRKKIFFRLLTLFVLIFALTFFGGKVVKKLFFTYKFDNLSDIRIESNKKLSSEIVISDTSNRELTVAEKKSDFNYLFDKVIENYPRVESNKSSYDAFVARKVEFLDKAINSADDRQFFNVLWEYMKLLDNRKTRVLSSYNYDENLSLLNSNFYEEASPYYKLLTDSRVKNRYDKLRKSSKYTYKGNSNLELKTLDNSIAYIKIGRMTQTRLASDHQQIVTFLKTKSSYKDLIIDVRGCGGISDEYWIKNLVEPITRSSYNMRSTLLFGNNSAEDYMDYLSIGENNKYIDLTDDRKSLSQMAEINMEKFKNMKFAKYMTISISSNNEGGFSQNVYVLQDKRTTDAADSFASFAKGSGFARLVGENSGAYGLDIPPFLYKLNHSAYILSIDSTITLNSDNENRDIKGEQASTKIEKDPLNTLVNYIKNGKFN